MTADLPKPSARQGFTCLEIMVAIVIIIVIAVVIIRLAMPGYSRITGRFTQTEQINNARQIALACRLYAQDHDGEFPSGTEPGSSTADANTILQDLLTSGDIALEELFWNPRASHVCASTPPNENGILEPGENAFDYVSGLTVRSKEHLPLLIEAQTSPHTWEGHLWDQDEVVVAYVDASARAMNSDPKTNRIRMGHRSGEVDLLSVSDEAGTIPGHLPPEAVVNRAAVRTDF